MWEARQLIASGVLPVSEYPTFDGDSGMGILGNFEETEEELEIELNEDEVLFIIKTKWYRVYMQDWSRA